MDHSPYGLRALISGRVFPVAPLLFIEAPAIAIGNRVLHVIVVQEEGLIFA